MAGENAKLHLDQIKDNEDITSGFDDTRMRMRDLTPGILLPKNKMENVSDHMTPLYIVLVKNREN